jgi:hypothetical protein
LTRVAVILHERLGNWARQLRPRLQDATIRWYETRSPADVDAVLTGLSYPVVLIDLGKHPVAGLKDLGRIVDRAPDARILVLDPDSHAEVAGLARELGATHVASGVVPAPAVAGLLARWIMLAQRRQGADGWSRTSFPESETTPWSWLASYLGDPDRPESITARGGRFASAPTTTNNDGGRQREIAIIP